MGMPFDRACRRLDDSGSLFQRDGPDPFTGKGAGNHPGRALVMGERTTAADQLLGFE
jgi:hypothetical protein